MVISSPGKTVMGSDWNTKEVVYIDDNAPLNGKIVVYVAARQIYDDTVTVFDAVTGEVLAT
jgi:hypothetical protein